MSDQAVSVVIPVYNSERYLSETVESVFAQTVRPDEVILVDDGSTDGTPGLLERLQDTYPLTVVSKDNGGEASARNRGMREASGDLVAFLDHDDVWHELKLERQLEQFAANPSLGASFTAVRRVAGHTADIISLDSWDAHPPAALRRLLQGACVGTASAAIVRREPLATVRFDERLVPYGCDWLMWLELAARGIAIGYVPEPLVEYRQHETNLNYSASYTAIGCAVMDRFFERNREIRGARYWRAHWHLLAAENGDGRKHLLKAALIRPASVRPGWVRLAL